MVAIKGQGMSKVAGIYKRMVQFGSLNDSLAGVRYVIGKGVPHEFFPGEKNMIVVRRQLVFPPPGILIVAD
jgi:hypothetical protein